MTKKSHKKVTKRLQKKNGCKNHCNKKKKRLQRTVTNTTTFDPHLHSVGLEILLPGVPHEVADVDEVVNPALDVSNGRLIWGESPFVVNDELERVLPLLLIKPSVGGGKKKEREKEKKPHQKNV